MILEMKNNIIFPPGEEYQAHQDIKKYLGAKVTNKFKINSLPAEFMWFAIDGVIMSHLDLYSVSVSQFGIIC